MIRVASVLGALAVFLPAPAALAAVHVSLRPGTGGPRTRFTLSFRAPARTGTFSGLRRVNRVIVSGPRGSQCASSVSGTLPAARAGARLRVMIAPGRGRHWCGGRFHGRLVAYESVLCSGSPARACPLLVIAPRTLARFSFRVKLSAGGGGSGGGGSGGGGTTNDVPTFAGLTSATTCSSSPPVHGAPPGRIYTLSWSPASDPVTPSGQLVYDIYFAATPGSESFTAPTWTTAPGAHAYSGTLATSGAAYFVVRARDAAGHEDTNQVERLAVNSC